MEGTIVVSTVREEFRVAHAQGEHSLQDLSCDTNHVPRCTTLDTLFGGYAAGQRLIR